jgi:hypothetical protein
MSRLALRLSSGVGIIIVLLGAVFFSFGIAPSIVPGGVPKGFLEFGGKGGINFLETGGGTAIMIIGGVIWKFGQNRKSVVSAGIVLVLLLSLFSAISSLNSNFVITGVDVTMQYGPHDQGFFGPTEQTFPIAGQPNGLTVDEGSAFQIAIELSESSSAAGSGGIASIKAIEPGYAFAVTSVSPALPITFSPGSSTLINVSLRAPFYATGQNPNFSGAIDLLFTTTGN